MKNNFIILFLIVSAFQYPLCWCKYILHDLQVGPSPQHVLKGNFTWKHENDLILLKGALQLPQTFTDSNLYDCQVFLYSRLIKQQKTILQFKGRGACSGGNQYGGSIWINLQKDAGVAKPGECPIPKGNYTLNDYYTIDLDQVTFMKMVPKGTYGSVCQMKDGRNELTRFTTKFSKE